MKKFLLLTAVATLTVACQNEKTPSPSDNNATTTGVTTTTATSAATTMPKGPEVAVNGVGTCTADPDTSASISQLINMADANGDGQISKDEATTVSSFLIGGFFFRADANSDGTVTAEEGKDARAKLASEHPAVAAFFMHANKDLGGHPFQAVTDILNVDYGKPLTMADARNAARSGVDDFFRVADANHDGRISPAEMKELADEGVRAAGKAMFQAADTDHSGGVSLAEFQAALQSSEKTVFDAADTNKNGQLTEAEAAAAMNDLAARVRGMELVAGK